MRNRFRILAAALAALLVLAAALYAGLNTGPGRRAALALLRPALEEALGGEVRIGGAGGHWPHRIVLRDVTLADAAGPWLHLDELTLRWNPAALLAGRIGIAEVSAPGGTLHRLPGRKESRGRSVVPRIPRLPPLGLGRLHVAALKVKPGAAGRETVLQVTGSADLRPDRVRLALDAATADAAADRARIRIDWAPAEGRRLADVQITGPEGGLFARLIGARTGGVRVALGGAGPATDWAGQLEAEAGDLGRLKGAFRCDCRARPRLALTLDAVAGAALPEETRRNLGPRPHLEAVIASPRAAEWTLEVTALEIAAAKLHRPLRLMLTGIGDLQRFDLSAALVPEGGDAVYEITARGGLPQRGGVRIAEAAIVSQSFGLLLEEARIAPGGRLAGRGRMHLSAAESGAAAAVTGGAAHMTFTLAGDYGKTIRLETIRLRTDAGAEAAGAAAFMPGAPGAIAADLEFTVPPAAFAAVTGLPAPKDVVSGALRADGTPAALSATLSLRTPELALTPRALPQAESILVVTGPLAAPEGELTVRRRDAAEAPPLLSARVAWPERNILTVANLMAELDGARLEGEGRFEPDTGRLSAKGKLAAPDLAVLLPNAAGSLTADFAIARNAPGDAVLTARAEAPALAFGETRAKAVNLSVAGPLRKLMISARAHTLDAPGAGPLGAVAMAAEADLTGAAVVTVREFSAEARGTPLALAAPARLTAAEGGFTLSPAAFTWGEGGRVTAAARVSPNALKVEADLTRAALPGRAVLVTGTIRLDTDEATPGTVDLRLEPAGAPSAFLRLTGFWNGRTLDFTGRLEGRGAQASAKGELLTASLPLALVRADGALSIRMGGDLDARLRYRGRLEPLMAVALPQGGRDFGGDLYTDLHVHGPLTQPRADGTMVLSGGRYENTGTGIALSGIDVRLTFAGEAGSPSGRFSLSAWDDGKRKSGAAPLSADGDIALGADGLHLTADVQLRKATLVRSADLNATLSGKARLSGLLPRLTLSGDLFIDRLDLLIPNGRSEGVADVPVVLVNEKGEPLDPEKEETADGNGGPGVALDLRIRSDGRAFIRGRGIDSEWKADLAAGGTVAEPRLSGPLTLKKGTVSFAGRRFTLATGEVTFTGASPPDPALAIAAEYETQEGTKAIVRVSGRASEPSVELVSEPPLPRDHVMALVLFGKPVTELTALQALQVTQSLAQLTGTGPFGGGGIMDRARRTLGLDLLDLTLGAEKGDMGLTVGRYLSEGIFVSATQDTTGAGGKVTVEVDITDEFSVKTDVGQDASGGVTAQWKKDY